MAGTKQATSTIVTISSVTAAKVPGSVASKMRRHRARWRWVNQAFASRFFPKLDPIGKHFGMGDPSHSGDFEIVGVVEDTKYQDGRGPASQIRANSFANDPQRALSEAGSTESGPLAPRASSPARDTTAAKLVDQMRSAKAKRIIQHNENSRASS